MTEMEEICNVLEKQLENDNYRNNNLAENHKSLHTSQTFYDSIYENLGNILKFITEPFKDRRKRDMALVSSITMISGCMPKVSGNYDNRKVYTNLYTFIIAPPASGKGVMAEVKSVFMPLHHSILQNNVSENGINNNERRLKVGLLEQRPIIQKAKMLFMPANTSSAALMEQLRDSDGGGILCETEADTVGETFKQDWGGYSDILRKAFHHEDLSSLRKGNNGKEIIEISEPKLSVCLTGTPSQIGGVIPNIEDGLFSRFIFYSFISEQKWSNPFKNNDKNLKEEFNDYSKYIIELMDFYSKDDYTFSLNQDQIEQFDAFFAEHSSKPFYNEDRSSIFRLGLITFRIAMILSALNHFDKKNESLNIECRDEDFVIARELCEVFINHSELLAEIIKKNKFISTDRRKQRLYDDLPKEVRLRRIDIVKMGKNISLAKSTTDNYLKDWVNEGILKAESYGYYMKP